MSDELLPWERVASRPGPDLRIFRARWDDMRHPKSGDVLPRVVLETPDWVNITAITDAGELVMVRQFRFGRGAITLEIPGGMVDPGESPEPAGHRELREETGFTSERWTYLGCVEPNPAFHSNVCHHFLAEGARKTGDPEPDPGEDLVTELIPLVRVPELIRDGTIKNSLVITAVSHVVDLRTRPLP